MKSVAVIGAGITGLAAAYRILERSQELNKAVSVSVLEAGPRAGGIIQSDERDGFLLERGPDSFISEKPQALNLANRLGLTDHLIETNPAYRRSFIVRNGKLRPVPEGFQLLAPGRMRAFLTSDIFSWSGKLRMAMDLLLPRREVNGTSDESLAQFVRRRLGREALERMAQPMVGGIYTADPEQLSLQATMPRFLEMERRHRSLILAMRRNRSSVRSAEVNEDSAGTSGARYSLFLSFDRGMQLLTDTLASRIDKLSNQQIGRNSLTLNSRVCSLELIGHGDAAQWRITNDSGDGATVDAVCLALPAFASARLIRDVDPQLAAELEAIKYASSATINLAYKRDDIAHPLDGFGFVVPIIERRSIMACTFSSVKFASRAPENHVLLRVFVGGALQPEMTELPEAELLARIRIDLRDLLGIDNEPIFHEISRWQESMPQYNLGHVNRVQSIEQLVDSLPGLALAGNAYTGLGIPDCIRSGEDAADALLASI
ncbi:MAG TPA: protoporphyrinogen oxidase [Pyrinomonadaceae bacterium]|nr:protoporphyrinogen oxidase [Pyrinomonadaceae bacterium]